MFDLILNHFSHIGYEFTWQDLVLSLSNIIFTYSLSNQVFYGFKNKTGNLTITTSLMTAIGLYATGIVFISLSLWFSAVFVTLNATLWLILFIQRLVYKSV